MGVPKDVDAELRLDADADADANSSEMTDPRLEPADGLEVEFEFGIDSELSPPGSSFGTFSNLEIIADTRLPAGRSGTGGGPMALTSSTDRVGLIGSGKCLLSCCGMCASQLGVGTYPVL